MNDLRIPSLAELTWPQIAAASAGGLAGLVGLIWVWKRPSAVYEIKTSIVIDANAQHVYNVLTDYDEVPKWNNFIRSMKGSKKVGETLHVDLLLPGDSAPWHFTPKILRADPGVEFCWKGSVPIPNMYNGEHYFRLTVLGPNQCRLDHGENFDGLLVPFATGVNLLAKKGFEEFNQAIKAKAESKK